MSFCFDAAEGAFGLIRAEIRPDSPTELQALVMRFELWLSECHEANHRLEDKVNHDNRLHDKSQKLADAVAEYRKVKKDQP